MEFRFDVVLCSILG